MSEPAALKFTYEDYCLLPEDRRYEVIDGEPLLTPAPTLFHQAVKGRIGSASSTLSHASSAIRKSA